jgi:hypothetical protein
MKKLLVGPLKASRISTLIIVGALDECKDEEAASVILSVLSRYMDETPRVKFFITGNPEPRVRSGFRLKPLRPITEIFRLHDVERSSADRDIKLFFRVQLAEIAKSRGDFDLIEGWPSPSDIDILCEKAAGLFIYTSTIVKLVAFRHRTPTEQLERLISLPQNTGHEGRSGVDLLYTQILEQVAAHMGTDRDNKKIYSHFKTVVGAVLLVFNPLSVRALSDPLKVSNIYTTLHSLHSLLIPDTPEDPIRIFHKSLLDFLTDQSRCNNEKLFVDPAVHHAEILLSCLELIRVKFKRNICNLGDYVVLDEVKDLSAQKRDYIGDALMYTCQFWTKHLNIPSGSPCVQEVQ